MLSEGFWKRRFASDGAIVGKAITLDNRPVTVVGVMPLDFGSTLLDPGLRVDLYVPLPLTADVNRLGNSLAMIGRLRPGVTIQQGESGGGRDHARDRRAQSPGGAAIHDGAAGYACARRTRPALFLLIGAVGVVMLVLCANVSHLQLARASARGKEMSIRAALGAGRGRLMQQLLVESLLLFGAASLMGLALADMATYDCWRTWIRFKVLLKALSCFPINLSNT
ncbi:MAG: ABC transporter permease [Paludibaculum sp.]